MTTPLHPKDSSTTRTSPRRAEFGQFRLDLVSGELFRFDRKIRFHHQCFIVLRALLENPGELVTREDLQKQLWPEGTHVGFEDGLNTIVRKLRNSLSDDADHPQFIETVPRRGYRFISLVTQHGGDEKTVEPVKSNGADSRPESDSTSSPPATLVRVSETFPQSTTLLRLAVLAVLTISVLVGFAALRSFQSKSAPRVVRTKRLTHSGAVHANQNVVTDGPRLFFIERENGDWLLKDMSSSGGPVTKMQIPLTRYDLQDISPDASEFLVRKINFNQDDDDSIWIMPAVGGAAHRVGDLRVLAASFAPDGQHITYSTGPDVFLCNRSGHEQRKLFSTTGDVLRLRWSPKRDVLRFAVNNEKTNSIWEVNADGTSLHQLLKEWNSQPWIWTMAWSPDARWFAFSSADNSGRNLWIAENSTVAGKGPEHPHQLTTGPLDFDLPVFSKDGNTLYAVGTQRRGEILRFDSTTHDFAPFLAGISAEFLSFSKKTKRVAYVSYPEGNLWVAQADGSGAAKITDEPMRVLFPIWSTDDSQIAFIARTDRTSPWKAYIVSPDKSTIRAFEISPQDVSGLAFAPDGKSLIVSCYSCESLFYYDLATGHSKPIPNSAKMSAISLSPTGRYVAAQVQDTYSLDVLDLKTGERRRLTNDGVYPRWSADERYVYANKFYDSKPKMLRIRLSDLKSEDLFTLKSFSAGGSLSTWSDVAPDGSVIFMRDLGGSDLYAIEWRPE
jgi:DNA-binding winged helix-turn-helix (wHTH) protein/Tol biopolymer transport system component